MIKNSRVVLLLSLLFCQLTTYTAAPLLGGLARVAGRLASTGLRTGGARVADEVRKDPKAAAAGVAGGYIGYQAAGGSKFYGALGGGITGYCLAKRGGDIRTLQTQLQTQEATAAAFATQTVAFRQHVLSEFMRVRMQVVQVGETAEKAALGALRAGQHAKNIGVAMRVKARDFKTALGHVRSVQQKQYLAARKAALTQVHSTHVTASTGTPVINPTPAWLQTAQSRLAAFKANLQEKKFLAQAALNLAKI